MAQTRYSTKKSSNLSIIFCIRDTGCRRNKITLWTIGEMSVIVKVGIEWKSRAICYKGFRSYCCSVVVWGSFIASQINLLPIFVLTDINNPLQWMSLSRLRLDLKLIHSQILMNLFWVPFGRPHSRVVFDGFCWQLYPYFHLEWKSWN